MITIKKLFLFIALTVLGVSLLATPKTANATFNPKATICHNGNTIEVSLSALPAHLLHGDKLGACVVASPTPTPTVSPTASPTATPSATPTSTPEATEEPCVSGDYVITKDIPDGWPTKPCDPEPTPAPTEQPTLPFSASGPASANICHGVDHVLLPGNALVKRQGAMATVQWQPTQGSEAHIYYYQNENTANAHAVRDTQNDGIEPIFLLGSLNWTFGIQQKDGCATSGIVWVKDDNKVQLFRALPYLVI